MNVPPNIQEFSGQLPELDLPGLVAPFLRAFFGAPQGVQMVGGIVGGVVGLTVLIVGFRRRVALLEWVKSRRRATQIGMASTGIVLLAVVAVGGGVSWNYMQHDNDFCTGCHVMEGAFERFTESGHSELNCHDCHQQSIFASSRQLHLWIRDRPEEIGDHAKVANEICTKCHINDDPADNWFQIAATVGHVAHLESDSSALANVQCVTCHGQEVHQFMPADQTCGQSECHSTDDTDIILGGMTEAEGIHCVACHEFTAVRVAPAPVDSTTGLLTPGLRQCFSCHEMEDLWADYDPLLDPHDARCGACHNPHEQDRPELALKSCTAAGCHTRPDTLSTLHVGLGEETEENCTGCHKPHSWSLDGDDCAACHEDADGNVTVTVAAAVHSGAPTETRLASNPVFPAVLADARAHGPFAVIEHEPIPAAPLQVVQQESFSHPEHTEVECIACHSNRTRHGELTVRTQGDCFSCHHATETAAAHGCGECHGPAEMGRVQQVTTTMRMTVGDAERIRALPLDHEEHADLRCVDCHGGDDRQRVQNSCSTCHEDHHAQSALASCAACHEEHREDAHTAEVHTEGCTGSGCHTEARYSRMDRTREFCATCHQEQIDHEPAELCVNCHLVPVDGNIVDTIRP